MERKVFRSRISLVLVVFIAACILPALVPMIRSGNISNPGFYTLIGVLLMIVFIFGGIHYVIVNEKLMVKICGIPYVKINVSEIVSVKRSYNPLSSPASSLKRLSVEFKKGRLCLISPVREKEFLKTLKEINPKINIRVNDKKAWYRVWDWDI